MNWRTINDKVLHFLAGALVALGAVLLTQNLAVACGAAIVAGAAKEFYDFRGSGTVDPADFVATVFGGVAVAVVWALLAGGTAPG